MRNTIRNPLNRKKRIYIDYGLIFCVFLLVIIGLVMIYSTTAYKSQFSDFKSHLIACLLGVVAMIAVALFDFKNWKYTTVAAMGMGVFVIVILLTPLGITLNNATRWFAVGPISVQSAEVVKLCLILILAKLLSSSPNYLGENMREVNFLGKTFKISMNAVFVLAISLLYSVLLGIVSSNLSSAFIIMCICMMMIFVASYNYRIYLTLIGTGAAMVGLLVLGIKTGLVDLGFRSSRVLIWLDPENASAGVDNFQTVQALYAIGSGGITGKGIGEGIQKINKIPEAQNDMIFAVLCEELGFVGALLVIILFCVLITRLFYLACNANNKYDALIITGVMSHISIQAVLNIAVVTNTIPNTGVSLPFISSGGSSVLCLLAEIGMVLNVSKGMFDAKEE